jgi:hypothetical protein
MKLERKKAIIVGVLILFAYAVLASTIVDSKIVIMLAEVLSGLGVIVIAVIMFPLFKPFGKKPSQWYLVLRGIEGALLIITGFLFLISSTSSLKIYDWIHLYHAYIFAIAAFFFYFLLFKSKLIPSWLSIWGFFGSILLILVNLLEITNIITPSMLLYLPIMSSEIILAMWLILRGFNPSAITSESTKS